MDLHRIADLQKDLRKYKQIGPVRTQDILEYFKKQNLTTEQIKKTKISQTVVSISQHKADLENEHEMGMVLTAKKLIQQWKQLFQMKSKNQGNQTQNKTQTQEKTENKILVRENVDISNLPQELEPSNRNKVLATIYRYLMVGINGSNPEKAQKLCIQIEKLLYSRNRDMSADETLALKYYKQDAEKLISSMKERSQFCKDIINEKITAIEIGNMDQKIFFSEKQKQEHKKLLEDQEAQNDVDFFKNKKKAMLKDDTTGEICIHCGKATAYLYKELQIRGADEPMTRYMECNNCGKEWND